MAPYIVTGYVLVAIISVNEYLISYMVSGFAVETLPIRIFNNVRYGYSPVVASAAMGFAFLTVLEMQAKSTEPKLGAEDAEPNHAAKSP